HRLRGSFRRSRGRRGPRRAARPAWGIAQVLLGLYRHLRRAVARHDDHLLTSNHRRKALLRTFEPLLSPHSRRRERAMGRIGLALAAGLALALGTPALAQDDPGPIAVYGNKQTFEIAPVLVAAEDFYPGEATVRMGSLANLVGAPPVPGFGEEGEADVATNAETQLLRYSAENPNLRVILGVSEGLYRIVARRSAGIESVADLKGKAVATIPQTSAGYFLHRMLERAGLTFADIEARPIVPLAGMTEALRKGEVDAVVIWEPESENAAQVLGPDMIEFSG